MTAAREISRRPIVKVFRIACRDCDAALTIESTGPRAALQQAEAADGWLRVGPGGLEVLCPAHEPVCHTCERPMPHPYAVSLRIRTRARNRARAS